VGATPSSRLTTNASNRDVGVAPTKYKVVRIVRLKPQPLNGFIFTTISYCFLSVAFKVGFFSGMKNGAGK